MCAKSGFPTGICRDPQITIDVCACGCPHELPNLACFAAIRIRHIELTRSDILFLLLIFFIEYLCLLKNDK